ncbi:protein tyrosine phosphatase [Rhodoblastus acidophilus]|uniref:Protein tyrosine phosphatase n=1 Tax=Rhodoblastus acidophilus TaxID=1074 RepID=A0A6N8DRJ2_RHOAC|nr:protein tyrosine phosphatase [Rhodoblastus acidophilus]MCW2276372.1 putative protein tyrosine phosphatase [Rhodoblastus acidophilus]MTV33027.1 protein tyrosine phosphatase [Rhodoblastus acidophilus]
MSAVIWVCAINEIQDVASKNQISAVVSLGDATEQAPFFAGVETLRLEFADVARRRRDLLPPTAAHARRLIAFAQSWGKRDAMLVHCWRGIGRSPAAAFIVACALSPERAEAEISADMYRASPSIQPNRLLVALGDAVMGRRGRMIDAIERFGDGDGFGAPFALPIEGA